MPAIDLSKPSEQQTRWSLYLGIVIWFVHLNTINALISVSCKWGGLTAPAGSLSWLQIVSAIITLVAVVAMLFLIYLPWRQWRAFQSDTPATNPEMLQDTEKYRRSMMGFVAMGLNSFLALYIIVTFIPTFSLKACGQA